MKKKTIDFENIQRIDAEADKGLSNSEVAKRMSDGLDNRVKTNISKSYFKILCSNLFTFFNLLCVICFVALLSVNAELGDYAFIVIFTANALISIVQEIRAKRAIDKLSLVTAPTSKVIRDGKEIEIPVSEIVLDDVIVLDLGAQIPADCLLLDGKVEVNESLLTGESVPVKKNFGDMLYSGSYVSGGSCRCKVEKIGDQSYIQILSKKAKTSKGPQSKLLASMNAIIKTVGLLIFPIAAVMGLINYKALAVSFTGAMLTKEVVTKTAAVVIGMIPSGMFLLTTMALAVGVVKLTKMHTLVRDKYSLEMLARADVLCLDKTGTITDGLMVVKECVEYKKLKDYNLADIVCALQNALNDNNQTATALRDYFKSDKTLSAIKTVPFSSARKYSAAEFNEVGTILLGAPTYLMTSPDKKITAEIERNMHLGRRVVMLASSTENLEEEKLPTVVEPIALIILEDNIRKEAIETIKWFKQNDVAVKVISGDDPMTVSEISRRAGIDNADKFVNLYGLSDIEITNIANKYTVFGRVSPEQKAVLVKALKSHGHTVAMTGDGVNDILAMKEADCSITVASGSSATRQLAHLVLIDNNFNSMPKVVAEGRRVINNIQQSSSLYLMKTMFTMIFALISIILAKQYPYTPRMMLMLEMFIIGLPSFALSLQPNDKRVEGSFVIRALTNALPGTAIMVFNMFVLMLIPSFNIDIPSGVNEAMSVLVLTLGGWAFLIALCHPFNKYRTALAVFDTAVILIWALFLMDSPIFKLSTLAPLSQNWSYALIVVLLVALDFALIKLFKSVSLSARTKLECHDFSE